MDRKIKYLIFDDTIQAELKPEDQINCKGRLIEELIPPLEFEEMLKRKLTATDKIIYELTTAQVKT